MIRVDIKRSQFYQENTEEQNQKYFSVKNYSFMHGIDNIYYSIFLEGDTNENTKTDRLFEILHGFKEDLKVTKQEHTQFYEDLFLTRKKFSIYDYNLSCIDLYDVFIADYLPNEHTPRIVVQIRAMALWVHGYDKMIKDSFKAVESLLEKFGLTIARTAENRLDYCYHTNVIQRPAKYFKDENLSDKLSTTFDIYKKVGHVYKSKKVYGSELTLEYLSLGDRKSNCLFFRLYDKTLEVVTQGYKAFFIELWYNQGLISFYDKYCLEYAYKEKNYDYVHKGKLMFYLQYGADQRTKREIHHWLNDENTTLFQIRELADKLMPNTTTILNIEFETRRKFYYSAEGQINNLPCSMDDARLQKLYRIIENRRLFLDYLTDTTLSFREKDNTYCDWWNRLRTTKMINVNENKDELIRTYAKNLEIEKIKKAFVRKLATTAVYKGNKSTGFIADISDMIADINDNDIVNGILEYREKGTEQFVSADILNDYRYYKNKKHKALKNRINTDGSQKSDK